MYEDVLEERSIKTITLSEKYDDLLELLKLQSYSRNEYAVLEYIKKYVKQLDYKDLKIVQDKFNNILITKGKLEESEFYPCVIAHTDTVHKIVGEKIVNVYESKYGTTIDSPTGIGGDDLCGVYLALKLLESTPKIKVVFTVEEECGAVGASKLDTDFFKDVGYLLEGDRKGNDDLIIDISGQICSDGFMEVIEPIVELYKFEPEYGMLTDIDVIKEKVNVSAINFSVGYYNPHTTNEFIILETLLKSIDFAKDLIGVLGMKQYAHTREEDFYHKFKNRYSTEKFGDYDDYDYEADFDDIPYTSRKNKEYKNNNLFDLTSPKENYLIDRFSGIMCDCGEELEERLFSYNCIYCNKIYIE